MRMPAFTDHLTVRGIKLGMTYATAFRCSRTGMVARPNT